MPQMLFCLQVKVRNNSEIFRGKVKISDYLPVGLVLIHSFSLMPHFVFF